jgi:uracil-DNA glycosylase
VDASQELEKVAAEATACVRCPLHLTRKHAVPGEGPAGARVMIIGEGPGATEDEMGRPFVGSAGRNLDVMLGEAGLSREKDVFITNTVKCRPPSNRKPRTGEIDACHPYLRRQIDAIAPEVILLLGDTALKDFFPDSTLRDMHGKVIRRGQQRFFATYHPAAVIYNRALIETLKDDFAELGRVLREGSD